MIQESEMNVGLTTQDILKRFAEVNQVSEEEATQLVGADTVEEMMAKINQLSTRKIRAQMPPMNRKQKRALKKKMGKNNFEVISDTATKLNMIHLIQELRKLNAEKEKEIAQNEGTTQDD